MRDGVLPLRPLTIGEILDAAVALLRRRAVPLLLSGALLAVLEQAVLYPLRRQALWSPEYWLVFVPFSGEIHDGGAFWRLVALGFGTESLIITLLGGLAAPAARAALLGEERAWPAGRDRARQGVRLVLLAVVLGLGAAGCAWAGFAPWIAWYALTGLAAPVLVIDRRAPVRALGRSIALVCRGGQRPGLVRLLAYLAWCPIRIAFGMGAAAAFELVLVRGASATTVWLITMAAWAIVDTAAYAALACLDAVVHLENRMRVEGLDIALARALHAGAPTAPILAVSR